MLYERIQRHARDMPGLITNVALLLNRGFGRTDRLGALRSVWGRPPCAADGLQMLHVGVLRLLFRVGTQRHFELEIPM
jgi:hypothetical protein